MCPSIYRGREKFRAISITFVGGPNGGSLFSVAVDRWNDPIPADQKITAMPANKGNLSTPHKEKPGNGLTTGASKKKKRCTVKHKRHCKQYLVSERNETLISLAKWTRPYCDQVESDTSVSDMKSRYTNQLQKRKRKSSNDQPLLCVCVRLYLDYSFVHNCECTRVKFRQRRDDGE